MAKKSNRLLWWLAGGAVFAIAAFSNDTFDDAVSTTKEFLKDLAGRKKDFAKQFYPFAKEAERATGFPALVTLAQAALESAWGKHAPYNNFFGHKKGSADVPFYESKTWEYGKTGDAAKDKIYDRIITIYKPGQQVNEPGSSVHGKVMSDTKYAYRVYGKFRKYSSPKDAFIAHGDFLKTKDRYKAAFANTANPKLVAAIIHQAGYATDPDYTKKLHGLIDEFSTYIA